MNFKEIINQSQKEATRGNFDIQHKIETNNYNIKDVMNQKFIVSFADLLNLQGNSNKYINNRKLIKIETDPKKKKNVLYGYFEGKKETSCKYTDIIEKFNTVLIVLLNKKQIDLSELSELQRLFNGFQDAIFDSLSKCEFFYVY